MAQLIERTYITDPRIGGLDAADIAAVEQQLGVALPAGYATWMQTLGAGEFAHYINVTAPADLAASRHDASARLLGRGLSGYGADVGQDALTMATSIDGDTLLLLPRVPDRLFFVPRHQHGVRTLANDLADALAIMAPDEHDTPSPRPVFVPNQACFEQCFTIPYQQQPFARVQAALCASVAHEFVHEGWDDPFHELWLYSLCFFGYLVCYEDADHLQVRIKGPLDQIDQIKPILNCLQALGFMDEPGPPTPAERAELERIVYVTHNYHYLTRGRFRDISLSRERPNALQKQLYAALLQEHGDQILWNPCPACGRQRRTPRARQCLNCGTFA